ncbi:cytochrome c biogenesis CcdA family protein [Halocynthiibacter namhaensis]|uniref:cytochrome c biogenesis CcdA family protein n=1 Tax=Halocynthiibacter namhaensis TaxID=1290553 RepID=UPI0005796201|nr:cytochrome c biogenesis CcdA family protein [Halocynthiibacter namhaensis]
MELIFAYGAGLLTLINPCVLPVLPIVLAGGLQNHRHAPAVIALGMSLSFVILGLGVAALGFTLGIRADDIARYAAIAMILFGVIMLVPRFGTFFTGATAGVAARADGQIDSVQNDGLRGQFLGGALLGAVWSPCIGPTLGGAVALASQGESLLRAGFIMVFFALGVSTLILLLGYGARAALMRRQAMLRRIATVSKPLMGIVFILVGTAILLKWHHIAEAWALQNLPYWLADLSVAL